MRHRPLAPGWNRASARAALVLLGGALACFSVPDVDRQQIKPWLVCSDCTNGELGRAVGVGPRAVWFLRAAVIDGPTAADDSILSHLAVEGVMRARRYRGAHLSASVITTADSLATVQRQLDDFRLRYRLRAAQALRQLDPEADSVVVKQFCASTAPELQHHPEYRVLFKPYGICP